MWEAEGDEPYETYEVFFLCEEGGNCSEGATLPRKADEPSTVGRAVVLTLTVWGFKLEAKLVLPDLLNIQLEPLFTPAEQRQLETLFDLQR